MPYRQRLIIEGGGCRKNLDSRSFALGFMEKLSEALGMRILVPPVVVRVPISAAAKSLCTIDQGVTGFVIWMESGAQIHTWPNENLVTLDAYSCKKFKVSVALGLFQEAFNPMEIHFASPDPSRHGEKRGVS